MTRKKITDFEHRIAELLDSLPGSDAEKGKRIGVSRQTISAWRTGVRSPKQPVIAHIASVFNVSLEWLCGYDVPMRLSEWPDHPDILATSTQSVPFLGDIACGEPIFADEDLSARILVDSPIPCDFALRCKGDSMVDARILDGDIVFIKKQDYVDDGAIAAVLIDDEATLKRVYHLADGRIELRAENRKYRPRIIGGDETQTCRILGKAVAFQSSVL